MTQETPARETAREPLLELCELLRERQLREVGAEVASAIAHAVGTPLNVISGRAELIRHDPANALAQVARIEEQVKKLATGLRQIVDYLAVPEPQPTPGARVKGEQHAAREGTAGPPSPGPFALEHEVVDATTILEDTAALARPLARSLGIELLVDAAQLGGARVLRWHALGTLSSLVASALRHVPAELRAAAGQGARPPVRIGGVVDFRGVVFELEVPGVSAIQGWQIEHFQARPAAADASEFHRAMSICGAVVRGHGGRLQVEAGAEGSSLVLRFSCKNEAEA